MAIETIQKYITHTDDFVKPNPNVANVPSAIFEATVPRSLAWIIPGEFPLILKLQQADGSEIAITSELHFLVRIPSDKNILFPVSGRIIYHPWADLTTAQQRNAEFIDSLVIDLGVDFLPLIEEESLIIQLTSPNVIDPARLRIYIPYFEQTPDAIAEELAYREEVLRI